MSRSEERLGSDGRTRMKTLIESSLKREGGTKGNLFNRAQHNFYLSTPNGHKSKWIDGPCGHSCSHVSLRTSPLPSLTAPSRSMQRTNRLFSCWCNPISTTLHTDTTTRRWSYIRVDQTNSMVSLHTQTGCSWRQLNIFIVSNQPMGAWAPKIRGFPACALNGRPKKKCSLQQTGRAFLPQSFQAEGGIQGTRNYRE